MGGGSPRRASGTSRRPSPDRVFLRALFAFLALPRLGLTYTPIALGAVNFAVASALYWRYRNLVERPRRYQAAFWSVGIGLLALAALIRPIVMF